jgi:hypothetical protein
MLTKPLNLLKHVIKEQLLGEIKQEAFADVRVCSLASSHSLKTCKLGNQKYFLKYGGWSDAGIAAQSEFNLQIGVEYLAYQIYKLFGVDIPNDIHVVSNSKTKRIGIATSETKGSSVGDVPSKKIRAQLTNGMYVDMLLANWDVGNVENLIVQKGKNVVRIDPGGTLVFRARGERKRGFGARVGELATMHPAKGSTPAAMVYDQDQLQAAAERFNMVSSAKELSSAINAAKRQVTQAMQEADIPAGETKKWIALVDETIKPILIKRFHAIKDSADFVTGN